MNGNSSKASKANKTNTVGETEIPLPSDPAPASSPVNDGAAFAAIKLSPLVNRHNRSAIAKVLAFADSNPGILTDPEVVKAINALSLAKSAADSIARNGRASLGLPIADGKSAQGKVWSDWLVTRMIEEEAGQ